jgi:S1-C subfamily serine protease
MAGGSVVVALAAVLSASSSPGSARPGPLYREAHTEGRVPDARPADAKAPPVARGALPELSQVAQAVLPAVVGILTTQAAADAPAAGDPLKDFFEHFKGEGGRKGLATGFVIHPDGFIVTNAHVVEGAGRVEVEIGEEDERVPARVVGRDEASDIALLKVDVGRPLPVLSLGDSDRLQIAEWVMVVGNPFGLSHTVTLGIVSHTGRADVVPAGRDGYYDFIQTDASINPGNSGGPIVNLRGEVIGIATAINATGQGIGFAVPINMAKEIVGQLRDHGQVIRSWMGVSVRESRPKPNGPAHGREIVVTDVVRGGPAASSGLKVGDVITAFDGRRIPSAARLRWYVATAGVGKAVSMSVRRGAGEQLLRVELAELPTARTPLASSPPPGEPPIAPE